MLGSSVATKREYARSPLEWRDHEGRTHGGLANMRGDGAAAHGERRPVTPLQALMECAPGEEPQPSLEELAPLREIVNDVIERELEGEDLWLFEALYIQKLSLQECGTVLSKTKWEIRRWADRLKRQLAEQLLVHDEVRNYLGVNG